jgi:hypothetical protein
MNPYNKNYANRESKQMNRRIIVLLVSTAVLATAISVAACATNKPAASAGSDASLSEVVEDGQNPVMNFIGQYYGGRADVLVEAKGDDSAQFTITWSESYDTKAVWTMSGVFNEDTTSVAYADGVKKSVTCNSHGEVISEEVIYTDGKGEFTFSYDGVTWDDQKEHIADNMVFKWGNSVEDVLGTEPTEYIPEASESSAATTAKPSETDKPAETNKPAETEKPAQTTEAETVEEMKEPAHKTAAEISGTYTCGRATATVDASDPNNVTIKIVWSESADTSAIWRLSGKYNEDTESILYSGGVKKVLTYADDGEVELEEVDYTDGSGEILFSYDGFTWADYNENVAENMVFRKEA